MLASTAHGAAQIGENGVGRVWPAKVARGAIGYSGGPSGSCTVPTRCCNMVERTVGGLAESSIQYVVYACGVGDWETW